MLCLVLQAMCHHGESNAMAMQGRIFCSCIPISSPAGSAALKGEEKPYHEESLPAMIPLLLPHMDPALNKQPMNIL